MMGFILGLPITIVEFIIFLLLYRILFPSSIIDAIYIAPIIFLLSFTLSFVFMKLFEPDGFKGIYDVKMFGWSAFLNLMLFVGTTMAAIIVATGVFFGVL